MLRIKMMSAQTKAKKSAQYKSGSLYFIHMNLARNPALLYHLRRLGDDSAGLSLCSRRTFRAKERARISSSLVALVSPAAGWRLRFSSSLSISVSIRRLTAIAILSNPPAYSVCPTRS
jgi:hypothetical protein